MHFYIILKGKVQVQIPDPIRGSEIVEPDVIKEEEVLEEAP